MHLEDHMHQFIAYMKKKNSDFQDILLQQFNFQIAEGDAPTEKQQRVKKKQNLRKNNHQLRKRTRRRREGIEYKRKIDKEAG